MTNNEFVKKCELLGICKYDLVVNTILTLEEQRYYSKDKTEKEYFRKKISKLRKFLNEEVKMDD